MEGGKYHKHREKQMWYLSMVFFVVSSIIMLWARRRRMNALEEDDDIESQKLQTQNVTDLNPNKEEAADEEGGKWG